MPSSYWVVGGCGYRLTIEENGKIGKLETLTLDGFSSQDGVVKTIMICSDVYSLVHRAELIFTTEKSRKKTFVLSGEGRCPETKKPTVWYKVKDLDLRHCVMGQIASSYLPDFEASLVNSFHESNFSQTDIEIALDHYLNCVSHRCEFKGLHFPVIPRDYRIKAGCRRHFCSAHNADGFSLYLDDHVIILDDLLRNILQLPASTKMYTRSLIFPRLLELGSVVRAEAD